MDGKNLKKVGEHATRGILWLAGSVAVAFLTRSENHNPYSTAAFIAALGGLSVGAYKLLYKTPKHLWKGLVAPEIRIDKKIRLNQAIIDAIKDKKAELGFPDCEEELTFGVVSTSEQGPNPGSSSGQPKANYPDLHASE